jgi:hypothetical protein
MVHLTTLSIASDFTANICATGFGSVIGFVEHLQTVTTSNYGAIANSHTLQFTTTRAKSPQSAVSSQVDVPVLPDSGPRWLVAISHKPPPRLTAVSRLSRNHSCSSLYSLGTNRTGNISPNSSFVVAFVSVATITQQRSFLGSHYLATGLNATICLTPFVNEVQKCVF